MLIFRLFLCCFFCAIYSIKSQAQDQTALQLLETIQPSLVEVRVDVTKTVIDENGHTHIGTYQALGYGVIIDPSGIIVTNTHIIANANAGRILVGLSDGTILEAKVVYSSNADFSFIKIEAPYSLQTITWADSSDAVVGTPILALSNAGDTQQHVLGGAITQLIDGISSNNVELFELNLNLIPGDSGGPLLDNQGQLLGLIMAKRLNEENKTYAIASNKIKQEYTQYRDNPQP